jgi:hypothetical protein
MIAQLIKDKRIQDDLPAHQRQKDQLWMQCWRVCRMGFVPRHSRTERVMHHKKVYKALSKDELLLQWLRKQRVWR